MRVYFGDIHGHASSSPCYWADCPQCDPQAYYYYARWVSGLDFASLTEHDHSLNAKSWGDVCNAVKMLNAPGEFVTILGYEWTSIRYGHQNVYFLDDDGPLIRCRQGERWVTPVELWRALESYRGRVISVPHHVAVTQFPADWTFYCSEYQPVSEVTSLWGDFVQFGSGFMSRISNVLPSRYVEEVLEDGYIFGFVGGGDSHDCRPGQATFGGRRKPNYAQGQNLGENPIALPNVDFLSDETCNFRGLTGVWAEDLTRADLWNAIQSRHTYATTGARIQLKVTLGANMMGDCLDHLVTETMVIDVIGTALIRRITVYVNGDPIWTDEPVSDRGVFNVDLGIHAQHSGYCYVLIEQRDGHRAWSSPVWWKALDFHLAVLPNSDHLIRRDDHVEWVNIDTVTEDFPQNSALSYAEITIKKLSDQNYILYLALPMVWEKEAISGTVRLTGVLRYRTREQGFMTAKYGGDLWTSNNTMIKFYLPRKATRNAQPILEVLFRLQPDLVAATDITVDGIDRIKIEEKGIVAANRTITAKIRQAPARSGGTSPECQRHILLSWPDRAEKTYDIGP